MNKRPKLIRNTAQEEAAIERGIAADTDTFVPTDAQFAQMKRRGGRPKLEQPKIAVTVRYDADVLQQFRASGDGWQTRMNNALREWLKTHPV
ncbi:BrnA antitoxin family protein [Mycetohabitans sp. B46]|uniref:BrnA antitoxin family protein n=1 Tax=Mycetohabitans sp. B46 TaxID=2772536 RepID=UPI00307F3ED9